MTSTFDRVVQLLGAAASGLVLYGQPELGALPLWARTLALAVAFGCGASSARMVRIPGAPPPGSAPAPVPPQAQP